MEIKINTVITLDTDEKYMVLNETMYQENRYFLVMGMDEEKQIIESNVAILKEIKKENECYVEKVSDSKLIIELTNRLKSQLNEKEE